MADIKNVIARALEEQKQVKEATVAQQKAVASAARAFHEGPVAAAVAKLSEAFAVHGRTVTANFIEFQQTVIFTVLHGRDEELQVDVIVHPRCIEVVRYFTEKNQSYKSTGSLRSGVQDYEIAAVTAEEIVDLILAHWVEKIRAS